MALTSRAAVLDLHFTKIHGAALRRNGPEGIRQKLKAKLSCRFHALELHFDFHAIPFVLDLGFAGASGHQVRALEGNFRDAAAPVSDRLSRAGYAWKYCLACLSASVCGIQTEYAEDRDHRTTRIW